jgi:hypothetical protein
VIGAAVLGVVTPLNPTRTHQTPGVPAHGDFLHLHRIREVTLGTARAPREVQENEPLGACHPQITHAAIEFISRQPADVAQDETKTVLERWQVGDHIGRKPAIGKLAYLQCKLGKDRFS